MKEQNVAFFKTRSHPPILPNIPAIVHPTSVHSCWSGRSPCCIPGDDYVRALPAASVDVSSWNSDQASLRGCPLSPFIPYPRLVHLSLLRIGPEHRLCITFIGSTHPSPLLLLLLLLLFLLTRDHCLRPIPLPLLLLLLFLLSVFGEPRCTFGCCTRTAVWSCPPRCSNSIKYPSLPLFLCAWARGQIHYMLSAVKGTASPPTPRLGRAAGCWEGGTGRGRESSDAQRYKTPILLPQNPSPNRCNLIDIACCCSHTLPNT